MAENRLSDAVSALQSLWDWMGAHKWRASLTLAVLAFLLIGFGILWRPTLTIKFLDMWQGAQVEDAIRADQMARFKEGIDEDIANIIFDARVRAGGARSVGRVFVYALDDNAQLIAVEDVFESMDPKTEITGVREAPLPIENIAGTIAYMLQDPGNPRCISRNSEEYDDEPLREWLMRYGLKSSVACPIAVRGRLQGLLAISSRAPLERNPAMERVTRDAALKLTGYWSLSPKVQEVVNRIQKTSEE